MRGIVDLSGEVRLALEKPIGEIVSRLPVTDYLWAVASSLSIHKTHGVWDTQGI